MKDTKFEQLRNLSRGLVDFWQKNYCPHTAIIIDDAGIRVVRTEIFLPIALENSDAFYQESKGHAQAIPK